VPDHSAAATECWHDIDEAKQLERRVIVGERSLKQHGGPPVGLEDHPLLGVDAIKQLPADPECAPPRALFWP
jgi:hypothetical protein